MNGNITGRVFNIQRYSLHDGSGIRTLVFLKGCPFKCRWCSNPESQKIRPELGFIQVRCVGTEACGAPCIAVCPLNVIDLNRQGEPVIDRQGCDVCGACAGVCSHEALKVVGQDMSVDEVMAEVEKDRPFYRRSGGGVTIGGGEPLAQYRFAAALFQVAEEGYLHSAIETTGHAPWDHFESVLKHVDLVQMDLKHMDPQTHKELTGHTNELVLENLKKVLSVKEPQDVIIRIPVIPGCNDTVENIEVSAEFIAELGYTQIELILYHKLGVSKYDQYGIDCRIDILDPPSPMDLQGLKRIVERFGLHEMTGVV